ncbi:MULTISPECIES: oxidoreductase [Burkholderia]|uniref:oxidoreductase n=1 Tax=Burkholderia TaxID=32008 RepID=UPI00064E6FD1|nr:MULTISPECIES: oxidoreductase [Burkholderia]KML17236.1 2-dehydropantoate 2-reductase [Burkholderia cepacia]KML44834.1 2-dehydropantoate 2-reductase [Burkholderia lata]KMN63488.1 2-dehydropantoate 2-reductase [Burkholderia sp. LK4]MBE2968461.1 oxidoreductase [Burkholderia cepacia]MBW5804347.1 oxidoreductase [Burkholderia sp. COPS]
MTNAGYPTVALVGPGAIGTTVAAALHEAGRTPVICGRSAHEQLKLRFDGGEIVVPGPVLTDPHAVEERFDLVFVAVKSTQIASAAPWVSALCDANTVVCVLQNGVEQKAAFAPYAAGATVVPSVVWFPAQRESGASVWLRGKPRLTLPDTPASNVVVAALHGTRCAPEVAEDFISLAWRKLLQNAVAGLMVLTGRRAGMYTRSDITELSLAYLRECLEVARAEGAKLGDDVPQEIVDGLHGFPPDLGTSILADRQGNHPLEWDCRNGVVQRYGRTHGIPTPISDLVVPLLAAASDGPG